MTRTTMIDDVCEFQDTFSVARGSATFEHYRKHIDEELKELDEATTPEDLLDALVDLTTVCIGAIVALDCDAQGSWDAVHRANMSKDASTPPRPVEGGKLSIRKPEGWLPPNLTPFLSDTIKNLPRFRKDHAASEKA